MPSLQRHAVSVADLGDFTFRHRTIGDQFKIEAIAARMIGGDTESDRLQFHAMAFATVQHLADIVPEGWNPAAIDPLDEKAAGVVLQVFRRLREAEETFRAGDRSDRPRAGTPA